MSLGEGLENLSIGQKSKNTEDPVAKAIRNGKVPTVRDVKMSLKVLYNSLTLGLKCPTFLGYLGLVEEFNACYAPYGNSA